MSQDDFFGIMEGEQLTFAKDLKKVSGKVKEFSNNSDLSKVQE